ncbi:mitochondrial glycoprotein [Nitzschia inconspicua]|uniref:Mitochondrial glycoprotein n=1 Tax=Nitzschia inconspicua TaxID=303405 RepID=A0A9K3PGW2_9STRA|nr:mitochondrial glycoprotein [Nitzschia inconspicua]KAG7364138.1 mitochondrial glycoprotein [Nitzschia inconspicua]
MKVSNTIIRNLASRSVQRRLVPRGIPAGCRMISLSDVVLEKPFRSTTFAPVNARLFSSEAKTVLLDIMAKEEQEEIDSGNTKIPPDLKDLKATIEQNWRIVEDGATTSLFRKQHSHKIQVSFHCQDTVDELVDDEFSDDEEEPSPAVRFTVTITKAGKSLVFACFSEFGSCRIEGVSTTGTSPETVHDNQGTLAKQEYQGPDFMELAEELQDQLLIYLEEECGVNSDVASFIAMFSDYREEACYVNWLKETQSIVS